MRFSAVVLLGLASTAFAEVFFQEEFNSGVTDVADLKNWVLSSHQSDPGKFVLSAGKFYGDAERDVGLQTSQDARFYAISSKFDKAFSNEGKKLVIQFQVKHEQDIDCGGGYLKVFDSNVDQADLHGDSPYLIMFGPDICGPGTKRVHVIFNYNGKNLLTKKEIRCKDDVLSHVYTLIVNPDNTYEVKIDNEKVESGNLEDDWEFLPAKEIKDPEASKPDDWDERETIADPDDTKPENWDQPENIPDPEATQPDDWDEDDGEWQAPDIPNPDYKGEWKPKQIPNPDYKGKWIHPMIPNPDYTPDDKLYLYKDIGALGFDLWQVKSGTIFDNVLVTDDVDFAEQFAKDTWGASKDGEKTMKDAQDEEQRKKDEEAAEAAKNDEAADDEAADEDAAADDLSADDFDAEAGDGHEHGEL